MKNIFTLLALTISFSMNAQTGNTSTGTSALASGSLTGSYNSAFGYQSLYSNTTGTRTHILPASRGLHFMAT